MSYQKGLCSVIIPAYNCKQTIRETVHSALTQTYVSVEILIVDDASKDGSADVIQELAEEDERIRVFFLTQNGGVAQARNFLFQQVRGEYTAFLDSDDLWKPDKLEKQIQLLDAEKCDLVYSSYSFIDGEGKRIGHDKIVPAGCSFKALLKENYVLPSTVILHSSWLQGRSMDGAYSHEDFVFWLGLLQDGAIARGCVDSLVFYRLSNTNRSGDKVKAAKNRWIVYRDFLHLSVPVAAWYFLQYTLNGLRKYQGIQKS
nr:glycosyltransferase family 2 protein [uncultured Sphaerochaeta sp.]